VARVAKSAKSAANRAAFLAEKAAAKAAATVHAPAVVEGKLWSKMTAAERLAVWDAVLDAIRKGTSYRAACRSQGLDASHLWRDWISQGHEGELEEARIAQAEAHVARAAGRVRRLFRLKGDDLTMPEVARTKVGLEHDRWMAAVTAPKRYGPKVQVEKRVTKLTVELRDESGASFRIGQGA
jgi:hypothetical protein